MNKCTCPKITEAQYLLINDKVYKSCPGCSKKADEHVYYPCPDSFGTTSKRITENNPLGLQSHCNRCRAGKTGPHLDAVFCSRMNKETSHIIREIRFLPMSSEIFPKLEDAATFILDTVPNRGNTYFYKRKGMDCSEGALVCFQYSGSIIGYAIHESTLELDVPKVIDGVEYSGYYKFKSGTVTYFDKAITKNDFLTIDSSFKGFNQSNQKKTAALLPGLFDVIHGKSIVIKPSVESALPEELSYDDIGNLKEGSKKQITVNAYERNTVARAACIKYYKAKNAGKLKCEICGFDFGKVYGEKFADKIHIHHLVEISSIGEEYEVDATKELLPVCPNCHMIAHSRKPAYSPEEIKEMIKSKE